MSSRDDDEPEGARKGEDTVSGLNKSSGHSGLVLFTETWLYSREIFYSILRQTDRVDHTLRTKGPNSKFTVWCKNAQIM